MISNFERWTKDLNDQGDFELLDRTIAEFAQNVKDKGLVIFAGAGISVPSPCLCPTWDTLKREILGGFIDKLLKEDWPIKSYLAETKADLLKMKMRPETFFWSLTSNIGLQSVISMIGGIDLSRPNSNHKTIRSLMHSGFINAVITSNFDTYIERSLENKSYTVVRDDYEVKDFLNKKINSIPIFKPHGCLSKPSSMLFRIDHIQNLSDNKREFLGDLLTGIPLLITGYSGNDEDIFPFLKNFMINNNNPSLICIYRPADEPIQQWDISKHSNIKRINVDTETILNRLAAQLGDEFNDGNRSSTAHADHPVWKDKLSSQIDNLHHNIIAIIISHLCSLHGNHRRALSFANLAQDICEDTSLSTCSQELLQFILELQSRARKELGQNDFAMTEQSKRIRNSLSVNDYEEVIDALLSRAHIALRSNDLDCAEKDIELTNGYIRQMTSYIGEIEPKMSPDFLMGYFWYLGILRRKQSRARDAESAFDQAIAVAHAKQDIIHGCRILLDYGFAKCLGHDFEKAQQIWNLAAFLAERANDWDTAGKAAKNRGILLSVSDKPELGRPELERALRLFERAGNPDGMKRTIDALHYSKSDFLQAVLAFGSNA